MIPYAPLLDAKIPAFKTYLHSNGYYYPSSVKVNFSHNRAVAYGDVKGIVLKMKALEPGKNELRNLYFCQAWETVTIDQLKKGSLTFNDFRTLGKDYMQAMQPGNYYKIQIAYFSKWKQVEVEKSGATVLESQPDDIGPFSTIGIARAIDKDTKLSIKGLKSGSQTNTDQQTYIGEYSSSTTTEIVYRYKFDLKTSSGKVLETSGWQYPAGEEMKFTHRQWLEATKSYKLTLTITTVNGYETAVTYTIARTGDYPNPQVDLILVATQDAPAAQENGYVDIYLAPNYDSRGRVTTELKTAQGVLLRQREGDSITTWDELATFKLTQNSMLENFSWKDFSVAHGETYIYAIRFYTTSNNVTIWSDMIKSTDPLPSDPSKDRKGVYVQFENMYLGDGDKQLCIKLNPKVSSFKETILEQKTDTIGSKYPYFFRNGTVGYKEIPISGLISYWMDEDGYFLGMDAALKKDTTKYGQQTIDKVNKDALNIKKDAQKDLGFDSNQQRTRTIKRTNASLAPWYSTSLTNENFAAERTFKMEVFNWLTNGRPKLFRSAAEGNFVVRLMNTSLSPNDQLGRMLHTFSSTGYEVMEPVIHQMNTNENNVVSFPQWINYEDAIDQERTYVWSQTISNRSIRVDVISPSSGLTPRNVTNTEYALVEKKDNTLTYEFIFSKGTISSFKILIPNEDGDFIDDIRYQKIVSVTANKVPVEQLPATFAVPIEYCQEVIQHQFINEQGDDALDNLLATSHRYLFTIEENNTCSTLEDDLLYNQGIRRLYNLTVTPTENARTTESWIQIEYDDMSYNLIDLSDGKTRIYKDIDNIRRIEKGADVRVDIYALIQANSASALEDYIVDVSMLEDEGGVTE